MRGACAGIISTSFSFFSFLYDTLNFIQSDSSQSDAELKLSSSSSAAFMRLSSPAICANHISHSMSKRVRTHVAFMQG